MKSLPFDTCRCLGASGFAEDHVAVKFCQVRRTCARYVLRDSDSGPRTPFTLWLCSPGTTDRKIGMDE